MDSWGSLKIITWNSWWGWHKSLHLLEQKYYAKKNLESFYDTLNGLYTLHGYLLDMV